MGINALSKGNVADISLFLDDADARVSIRNGKPGNNMKAIIELSIKDDQSLKWIDENGHSGDIKVDAVASQWSDIEDAGRVRLGIQFTRKNGALSSLILEDVQGEYTENGTYRFSGDLAGDSRSDQNRLSKVVGYEYVDQYKGFLKSVRASGGFQEAVTAADLYLDTYNYEDYRAEIKNANDGISAKNFITQSQASDGLEPLMGSRTTLQGMAGDSLAAYLVGQTALPGSSLSPINEKDLRQAFTYAQNGRLPGGEGDPIFQWYQYQPPGVVRANQNKAPWPKGAFYYLNSSSRPGQPKSIASRSIKLGEKGQSLDLSFDLGHAAYGYVYVPDGVWSKLNASKYSAAALLGFQTGPSLKLNLGEGKGELSSPEVTLASTEYYSATPYGTISIKPSLTAQVKGNLVLDEGFTKDSLTGRTYANGAILLTYNTYDPFKDTTGFKVEAAYYFDADFKDFDAITGVTVSPTIAAKLAGSWGLFTPDKTPIIGKQSIFDISLDYNNPFSLNVSLAKEQAPKLTFSSKGELGFQAGFLTTLTDALTYKPDAIGIYNYESPNLL